jgi:dihydroneopterin aldolase
MPSSRISLRGIRARGHHGASPGEQDQPQDFVVDLDVEVPVAADELERTVDYRQLTRAARDAVANSSFALLESLAEQVALSVQRLDGVVSVTATVHKPVAAARLGVSDLSARATAPI